MRDKSTKASAHTVFTYQQERHTMTREGGHVLIPGSVLLYCVRQSSPLDK